MKKDSENMASPPRKNVAPQIQTYLLWKQKVFITGTTEELMQCCTK